MKKRILLFALAAMAVAMTDSCKKESVDPINALSVKDSDMTISPSSRDKKLVGIWRMSKFSGLAIEIDATIPGKVTTTKVIATFDGTTFIETANNTITFMATGYYELIFNNNGTLNYTQNYVVNNYPPFILSGTGTWSWLDIDKHDTEIVMSIPGDYNNLLYGINQPYIIDHFSSNEIVLKTSYVTVVDKVTSTYNNTSTFTKIK